MPREEDVLYEVGIFNDWSYHRWDNWRGVYVPVADQSLTAVE